MPPRKSLFVGTLRNTALFTRVNLSQNGSGSGTTRKPKIEWYGRAKTPLPKMAGTWGSSRNVILDDLSPLTSIYAVEQNAVKGVEPWTHWSGIELHKDFDLVWTMTNVPFFYFNSILHARSTAALIKPAIEKVLSQAESRNVPLASRILPLTQSSDLGMRPLMVRVLARREILGA